MIVGIRLFVFQEPLDLADWKRYESEMWWRGGLDQKATCLSDSLGSCGGGGGGVLRGWRSVPVHRGCHLVWSSSSHFRNFRD